MKQIIHVVTSGSNWKVMCKHCSKGKITDTQQKAIKIAKRHVAEFPRGTINQILIQGKDSKFQTEWTYGTDPFPPRG